MHEKTIIKCKFEYEIPFRTRIFSHYENITDIAFIDICDEKLMIATVDHKQIILVRINDNKIEKVD
jgi:hypothetical protein